MLNLKTFSSDGKGTKRNTLSTSLTLALPKSTSTPRPKNTFHTGSIRAWPALPDICPSTHIWAKVQFYFLVHIIFWLVWHFGTHICFLKWNLIKAFAFRAKPARWPGGFRPHVHVFPSRESTLARTKGISSAWQCHQIWHKINFNICGKVYSFIKTTLKISYIILFAVLYW